VKNTITGKVVMGDMENYITGYIRKKGDLLFASSVGLQKENLNGLTNHNNIGKN